MIKQMYKNEGIKSFWKGIVAPLMVETPKRAWKFCTFENFKNALNYRGKDKQPSPLTYSMAGFLAGATEGLIVNPFEAIKVRRVLGQIYEITERSNTDLKYNQKQAVQLHIYFHIGSNPLKVKAQSNTSHASQAPSTAAIVRQISLEEGNLNLDEVSFEENIAIYK